MMLSTLASCFSSDATIVIKLLFYIIIIDVLLT